ncbi:MAG: efflux RND transporter periplasmic adaptor subunit [Propionibacteriaceae bacterium]|jgi:RND family efflux transporter MFP subunit|nr:efflux RND transporter periplasmic adaptor subunit [Propionibacteriaceae bacterium]
MKKKTWIIGGVAAVVVAAGGGIGYQLATSGTVVSVAQVSQTNLSVTVSASGSLAADTTAGVFPPTSGTIGEIAVADGAAVTEGEVIATMATGPLKQALTAAQAALSAANAQVEAVKNGAPSSAQRAAANAAVSAAKSALSAAKKNYSSYNKQYKKAKGEEKKAMTATWRTMKVSVQQAQAGLAQAQAASATVASAGSTKQAKTAAADAVNAAKAALKTAKSNLERAELKAPISGVVTFAPTTEKGSGLTPGVAAFTVTDQTSLVFQAAVDETDIAKVKAGQQAAVTLDAYPDTPLTGKVTWIGQSPTSTATGSVAYTVKLSVAAGGNRVLEGMSGSAAITVEQAADATTVPIEAVLSDGDGSYVFVVDADGTAHKTAIKAGAQTDTAVQVESGVSAGQEVVTVGASTLADGQKVKVQ